VLERIICAAFARPDLSKGHRATGNPIASPNQLDTQTIAVSIRNVDGEAQEKHRIDQNGEVRKRGLLFEEYQQRSYPGFIGEEAGRNQNQNVEIIMSINSQVPAQL
jgi:hypothetical protein